MDPDKMPDGEEEMWEKIVRGLEEIAERYLIENPEGDQSE